MLQAVGAIDRLAHENHLFTSFPAAVERAREHLARTAYVDVRMP